MSVNNGDLARHGDRDTGGRFVRGNSVGLGNPAHKRMRQLRQQFLDCVDDQAVQEVTATLIEMAKGGDTQAMRIFYEWTIGRPPQAVELSGPDGEPLAMGAILAVITEALAEHPDARIKLAAAFHRRGESRDGLPQLGSSD
jgi:hypothetical protein